MALIKELDFGTPDRSLRIPLPRSADLNGKAPLLCGCATPGRLHSAACPGHPDGVICPGETCGRVSEISTAVAAPLVTLEIDGKSVTVPEGTSVMRAAMEVETAIPRLCATDSLEPIGSCRLCVVEIEGRRGTPAACTATDEAGMKVGADGKKVV